MLILQCKGLKVEIYRPTETNSDNLKPHSFLW